MLDIPGAGGLPEVIGVGEEDRAGAKGFLDALDGLALVLQTGDGHAVGVTLARPAGLEVHDLRLAGADLLENVDLALDELAGLVGGSVVVEERMDVGTDEVNGRAEGRAVLLPDVDGLGGGDLAVESGLLELLLGGSDEVGELASVARTTLDGLVTDDDHGDHVPLGPLGDGGHLLLSALNAGAVDEDTEDHLQAVLLAGLANVLETVAVGGVDTHGVEALLLDELDVLHDLTLALAATVVGVGGVGHAHAVATSGRLGRASRGAGGGVGGSRSGGGGGNGLGRLAVAVGERRAHIGDVGTSGSHGLLRLSVGARRERGGSRVDDDRARRDEGSRGSNGVSARGGADVGSGLDDTGDGRSRGLDCGNGASHGGRGLDNSGDTAIGVATTGQVGGGSTADGRGVGHGHGDSGDRVGTSRSEARDAGSRELNRGRSGRGGLNLSLRRSRGLGALNGSLDGGLDRSLGGGRRLRGLDWRLHGSRGLGALSRSGGLGRSRRAGRRDDQGDGAVAGRAQSGDRLRGDGSGRLGGLLRLVVRSLLRSLNGNHYCDRGQYTDRSCCVIFPQDLLTGRRAIEGDDLGGASAGGISRGSADDTAGQDGAGLGLVATLMEGVVTMATHMSNISHGRAHEGGRGGQNRTPHDDSC